MLPDRGGAPEAATAGTALAEGVLVRAERLELVYMAGTPFETRALRGVDLELRTGEILALIGATGSGKSSFLQATAGLIETAAGTIVYAEGWQTDRLFAHLGMVFQMPEDQLFERTVAEDVGFGPKMLGWGGERIGAATDRALQRVGLDPRAFRERSPTLLSGGEKRRVALAGILAMEPALLLLDEPTAGLDAPGQALLEKLVRDLRAQGTAVVMVTHDLELLVGLADRIGVFHQGVVHTHGPAKDVLADVATLHAAGLNGPFIAELMAALAAKGWPLARGPLTVEDAGAAILAVRKKAKR